MNPIVVQYGTGSTQSLIEGWSSLIWTERFREAGEFELRTPRVAEHFTQMPEGAAISLLDSREVMLVDTHTIEKNEKGESELVVKGKTFDAFLENRVIVGLRGTTWKLPMNYTPAEAASLLIWEAVIPNLLSGPLVSQIFQVEQADKISGTILTDSVDVSPGTAQEWWMEPSVVYPKLLDILKVAGLGIRIIRGPSTGKEVTFDSSGNRYVAAAAEHSEMRFDIYGEGTGIINYLVFSYSAGHLADAGYLFSNKNYKNVAYILSSNTSYDDQYTYVDGTSPSTGIGTFRRVIFVDPGIDQGSLSGTDYVAAMQQKGREALAPLRKDAVFSSAISDDAPYKYNVDYRLGDKAIVMGEYGFRETMQVVEYMRNEDINGERSFPGLIKVE